MRVKFFPKQSSPAIPAIKCNHRFGAIATFSHQTDSRFQDSIYGAELYGFKNNVRLGCFATNYLSQYITDIDITEATGLMRHDIYFGTDMWKNPNTGTIETIPDHYATAWTSAGAEYFNVTIGAAKASRTPTCGPQMYDISDGHFGTDANGLMGETNLAEFIGVVADQKAFIKSNTDRNCASGSYRNGILGEANLFYPHFLGCRNSNTGDVSTMADADTWYGSELGNKTGVPIANIRGYFRNYPSTTRWWDYWHSFGETKITATAYVQQELAKTLANNGWYRDFCHWHSCRNANEMSTIGEFLEIVRNAIGANFVWTCSNGEALEYMYLRELADRIMAIDKGGEVMVLVDIVDSFKGQFAADFALDTPMETINIPLSVEVDLSGTSLEGLDVVSSFGKIRALGANKYVIQVSFRGAEGFDSVVLSEGSGGYFDESIPTATTNTIGESIIITSNIPTRAVLFGVETGGFEYDSLPAGRSNELKTEHIFPVIAGEDYRVGIISEFGQANLITI